MFPQLFGKYVLERELAAGGMARVYLATLRGAVGFEKRLVVKQIRPELAVDQAFVRRFVEEAKTAVELSHPNIVPVYELGVEQGVYYIAMELCVGVTLSEMLAETGKLSPEEGAYVGVEICRALDYAHRRAGIVHRDVTPRNVLIDEEGAVRLIDFGIAAPVAGSERGPSEVFGSPGHMPPEQIAGKPLSASADVFAVAVLLYEAWTGEAAFRRATAKESLEALKEPPAPIDEKEPALAPLAELLQRGLAREARDRPAQAELFARPLRDFLRNVDAGDVARRLGARVRRVLRHARRFEALGAKASAGAPGMRDSDSDLEPSTHAVRGHTFAAREEVREWTRELGAATPAGPPSQPPSADRRTPVSPTENKGPTTRKLPSIPPSVRSSRLESNVPSLASAPVGVPFTTGRTLPRTTGSRMMVASLALVAALLGLGLAREAGRVAVDAAPVSGRGPRQPEPRLVTQRDLLPAQFGARLSTSPAAPAEDDPEISSTSHTALEPPGGSQTLGSLARQRPTRALSLSSSIAATLPSAAGAGLLRLTADLPATVSVQGSSGARSFSTPVRALSLPPGAYTIVFRSSTYGAPVIAQLTLAPNSERGVHVDFREAEPRVSLR